MGLSHHSLEGECLSDEKTREGEQAVEDALKALSALMRVCLTK
jgi:hypothetical protein